MTTHIICHRHCLFTSYYFYTIPMDANTFWEATANPLVIRPQSHFLRRYSWIHRNIVKLYLLLWVMMFIITITILLIVVVMIMFLIYIYIVYCCSLFSWPRIYPRNFSKCRVIAWFSVLFTVIAYICLMFPCPLMTQKHMMSYASCHVLVDVSS